LTQQSEFGNLKAKGNAPPPGVHTNSDGQKTYIPAK
jgi:hypothetical protein